MSTPRSKRTKTSTGRTLVKPVEPKSEIDLMFDTIQTTMLANFSRVQAEMDESFQRTLAEITSGHDAAVDGEPTVEAVEREIDTAFDRIEQEADRLVAELEAENTASQDLTVQAQVAFAKALGELEEDVRRLWAQSYSAQVIATRAQAILAAVGTTSQ